MDERQIKLFQAKGEYKTALKNLEMISDEIHERRRSSAMGPRGRGVGAEGSSISGDDISNFKMDSDGVSSEYKHSLPLPHFTSWVCQRCWLRGLTANVELRVSAHFSTTQMILWTLQMIQRLISKG